MELKQCSFDENNGLIAKQIWNAFSPKKLGVIVI